MNPTRKLSVKFTTTRPVKKPANKSWKKPVSKSHHNPSLYENAEIAGEELALTRFGARVKDQNMTYGSSWRATSSSWSQERFLRMPQVRMITGLSAATIYLHISLGLFPRQVELAPNAVGWASDNIRRWCASRKHR